MPRGKERSCLVLTVPVREKMDHRAVGAAGPAHRKTCKEAEEAIQEIPVAVAVEVAEALVVVATPVDRAGAAPDEVGVSKNRESEES
jgi:hypothetical protein